MLKSRIAASIFLVVAASQVSAQQAQNVPTPVAPENIRIEIDPMKGCYAADKFYSEGMTLETSGGVLVCMHSENEYGNRKKSTPFEWVKK